MSLLSKKWVAHLLQQRKIFGFLGGYLSLLAKQYSPRLASFLCAYQALWNLAMQHDRLWGDPRRLGGWVSPSGVADQESSKMAIRWK